MEKGANTNVGVGLRGSWSSTSASADLLVWGAQLTTAADDAAINGEYQRIAAAPTVGAAPTYDSDVTKFPPYLYATTDDAMSTASIDFSGGDEMSVFAGVTKESDAAARILCELTATTASNNGSFAIQAPDGAAAATYLYQSKGTSLTDAQKTSVAAPNTSVLTGLSDISGDSTILRVNGVQADADTGDQGSGNYANAALYLFARNNASDFMIGRLYSLIVRNKLTSGAELTNTESYVAQKTGVTL